MEENYVSFITFEEKNPRKFSIEMDHSNYGFIQPKLEVEKDINFYEEEKPSNNIIQNKTNTYSTNIFQISNIKENNPNENKTSLISQNINEFSNSQYVSEEKLKNNSSKENENSESNPNEYHSGRWTNEEHQKFIEGILKYGNEWKRVQSIIKTRSSTQARSHAQKFFLRLKKEINPKILADPNSLLQYIITSTNKEKNYTNLTPEQKERLFSVIRSNLKPEESQTRNNNNDSTNQYINKNTKDNESGLDYIKEEEYDNLAYNKENIINKKMSISDIGEKRKITFCSKKRKNSSDYVLNVNDNRIFTIKKDMSKRSMDITKKSDNLMNNLAKNNIETKNPYNEINNSINNNLFINNNNLNNNNINNINNNNFLNNDKYLSKSNLNNFSNTNFIIQNNYYNIINNYNNNINNNQGNINFNTNNLQNNFQTGYLNNDSINSDINNQNKIINYNNDGLKNKDKNIKNNNNFEYLDNDKNTNQKSIFENYTFLNNENFFPINKNNQNEFNKNFDNADTNDPFNLKFENTEVHNDNNTINNENMSLNNNLEVGHEIEDYEFERINFGRNNNVQDRPYDD